MSAAQLVIDNLITKLFQAYLVVGETSADFARRLVQQIYCPQNCGTCSHCHKLSKNLHPDLIWIRKSGKRISIDQVRELQHKALYPPVEASKKIYIIESVEDLSLEAANSLLKILESPPRFLIFVLLAKGSNILPTILSRCQVIKLPKPTRAEIESQLRENGFSDTEINYLFSATKGESFDQKALDSAKSFLQGRVQMSRRLVQLDDADLWVAVTRQDRLARREALLEVLRRLNKWNSAQVLGAAATMSKLEPDVMESFVREATYWYRDVLAAQHGEMVLNEDCMDELRAIRANSTRLVAALRALEAAPWKLQRNANVQLLLESLFFTLRDARA